MRFDGMEKWSYYVSGILYGRFEVRNDKIYYQWLDPFTACLGEREELDERKSNMLLKWSGLNVYQALNRVAYYETAFLGREPQVTTRYGALYSMREPDLYAERNTVLPTDLLFKQNKLAAFLCPSREACVILLRDGCEQDVIVLAEWRDYTGTASLYPVRFDKTVDVRMRDGIFLATDVYLPGGADKKLSTILIRTCYGKSLNKHLYYRYVQRGYAVVIQDVRGREDSEGEFIPMYNEIDDGDDTLNWIAGQKWSDGRIGTIGASYLGYVQWAMAASGNPHLAAMISIVTAGSAFTDIPRRGGLFTSGTLAWAFMMSEQRANPALMKRDDWDELMNLRPLQDIPVKALGKRIPFLDEWLRHNHNDAFWQKGDCFRNFGRRQIPALIMSGWFDDNSMGTTEALELTKDYPPGQRKVILGAWNHGANTRYDIHGVPMGEQALRYDLDLIFLKWFDCHLRGIANGIEKTPAVEYFTLTQNRWKFCDSWPPAACKPFLLYLGADGTLLEEPAKEGADSYLYDPQNPAPHVVDMSENELEVPEEYTEVDQRADVLCYTTGVLTKNVIVTGEMTVELFISSDAADTDFIVRIEEADEAGRTIKYADAMLGAKYRNGFDHPDLMEAGKIYQLRMKTTKLSKLFAAGNRIRLTVTSSAQNFAFPNSNTADGYNSQRTVVAKNTVYYGRKLPSQLILPIE